MDQGFGLDGSGFDSNPSHVPIDRTRVLDVKPLRTLAPVFPNSQGVPFGSNPHPMPFTCLHPTGPFPPGVQPFYPFIDPDDAPQVPPVTSNGPGNYGFGGVPNPVMFNPFMAPTSQGNVGDGMSRGTHMRPIVLDDDNYSPNEMYGSGLTTHANDADVVGRKRGRPRKKSTENVEELTVEPIIDSFLESFKLKNVEELRWSCDDRDFVRIILLVYDMIRRKLAQLEEGRESSASIITRRPDLKVGAILMNKGVRANITKMIGHVPGIEVGDIFYFRMELCIVGLHSPSIAGIDYMSVKVNMEEEEQLAVSIVSSPGYENEVDDGDVLIYSGQGGIQRKDGQMTDQKLERGNLALERSIIYGNDVRVIRGLKDTTSPTMTCKFYIYDGLYKIQKSWAEKNKSGGNVYKYKLVRVPGQPEAFKIWKTIQQWKEGTASRPGFILPDLSAGAESQPVVLVNDVDDEKGPHHFTYTCSLKYNKKFFISKPFSGCICFGGCHAGDINCPCNQKNNGLLSYSSLGIILTNSSVIHECGQSCVCPLECRNRMSQAGVKVRLEVFKTRNRGWGLRSWDPIRAGGFICEYAGDVVEASNADDSGVGNDDNGNYIFDAARYYEPLDATLDESAGFGKTPFPLIISAKRNGNVARFMNHSCSPNVHWQPVLRESNYESCLHIAFFAIRHIPPLQELTYDYGMVLPEKEHIGRKNCLCGFAKCRGFFY